MLRPLATARQEISGRQDTDQVPNVPAALNNTPDTYAQAHRIPYNPLLTHLYKSEIYVIIPSLQEAVAA